MRLIVRMLILLVSLAGSAALLMAADRSAGPVNAGLLPQNFAGWERVSSQSSRDPAAADPTKPELLKEYGFTDSEVATYRKPEGRQITIKAARFTNASGAYGAFTFYKEPPMITEQIGDQGASLNERVLFYRGNILLQTALDRRTAMSAAELRELAAALPIATGPNAVPPTLPLYLPRQAYVRNSAKYVMGPIGLASVGAPLTMEQVNFDNSPEVVEGRYSTGSGTATLALIQYPTPQIAIDRARAFEAVAQNVPPNSDPALSGPLNIKRSGPIVALVTGRISSGEAKSLLASINYDANITWNENTSFNKKDNLANFLVNLIFLIGIILAFALVSGLAFAALRLTVKRIYPGRIFDRPESVEIIQLKLSRGDQER